VAGEQTEKALRLLSGTALAVVEGGVTAQGERWHRLLGTVSSIPCLDAVDRGSPRSPLMIGYPFQNDMTIQEFLSKKEQEYEERFHSGPRLWRTEEEKDGLIQHWFIASLAEGLALFAGRNGVSCRARSQPYPRAGHRGHGALSSGDTL
jgi:hypothetical protein